MTDYLYISADNHLDTHWCPKNLWQDRLPAKFKDIGPKVIEGEGGSQWTWEGKLWDKSADGSNSALFLKPFRDHGVDSRLADTSLGQQRFEIPGVDRSRHLHVHARVERLVGRFAIVRGEALNVQLLDRPPVADHEAVEPPLLA